MPSVKPVPDQYHSITPYLRIKNGAAKAIDFYVKVFGATERGRVAGPDGMINHAEIVIGDSVIMLSDAPPATADAQDGAPNGLVIYTADVDTVWNGAIAAGATEVRPLEDQFYGDRMGVLRDPFGNEWSLGMHIEDVSEEEIQRRMQAMPAMS